MEAKYAEIAQKTEAEVLKFEKDTSWKFLKTIDGIEIHSMKSPHFNGNVYKFSFYVDAPHEIVYEVLKHPLDGAERLAWDKSITKFDRIATFNEDLTITAISFPSLLMGMIPVQEVLSLSLNKTITGDEPKHWVFVETVDYNEYPIKERFMGVHSHPTGYSATPVDGDKKTKVEFFINVDPGRLVPRTFIEMALPSEQAKHINCFINEVMRRAKQS